MEYENFTYYGWDPIIARCTVHGRRPLDEKKNVSFVFSRSGNCDTCKTIHHKISCFDGNIFCLFPHKFLYSSNKKLQFHPPRVRILGNNNCGNTWCDEFKRISTNQDVLCHSYYAERLVAIFAHQIQSEYYGGNRYVSIEGIAMEHFIAPTHIETPGTPQARTFHSVFHSFLTGDNKQDSATNVAHI